jgi:hypothetical protein
MAKAKRVAFGMKGKNQRKIKGENPLSQGKSIPFFTTRNAQVWTDNAL